VENIMSFLAGIPAKIKTLLDRLTATRAAYLDYINTLYTTWTSSLASDVSTTNTRIARLNTDLTTARCENIDNGGGYMYVQHFDNIDMSGLTSKDQAISAVTQSKTWLIVQWEIAGAGTEQWALSGSGGYMTTDLRWFSIKARLTSSTNVRIERTNSDVPITVNLQVIEWKTS
jgi:hypothetical protein